MTLEQNMKQRVQTRDDPLFGEQTGCEVDVCALHDLETFLLWIDVCVSAIESDARILQSGRHRPMAGQAFK